MYNNVQRKVSPMFATYFRVRPGRRRRTAPRHCLTLTILLAEMLRAGALDLPARHV